MKFSARLRAAALSLMGVAMLLPLAAHATITSSLPQWNTPGGDWTEIRFADTTFSTNSTSAVLSTVQGQGVWFGSGSWYGDTPNWSLGSSTEGNHFSMTASFSGGSVDWSAYLLDGTHEAAIQFLPSGCADNCYGLPGFQGIEVYVRNELGANVGRQFALDMSVAHEYEFLLKGGLVSYRVDGVTLYSGDAAQVPFGGSLLVVGDGSGSTWSGVGSMTVHRVSVDNAPTANVLSSVPEPQTWALALVGALWVAGRVKSKNKRASTV